MIEIDEKELCTLYSKSEILNTLLSESQTLVRYIKYYLNSGPDGNYTDKDSIIRECNRYSSIIIHALENIDDYVSMRDRVILFCREVQMMDEECQI